MIFVLCLVFQDLNIQQPASWAVLARPWMTTAEAALFDRLDDTDRIRFRGWFVARRLENPEEWPATGAYLPKLFCPREYGDIRDQIFFALGEPTATEPMIQNPDLPGKLIYPEIAFELVPDEGGRVSLAPSGIEAWDSVLRERIHHPELKYDFSRESFGRTRLPETMNWLPATVRATWWTPETDGGLQRLELEAPSQWLDIVRTETGRRQVQMELLVQLYNPGSDTPSEAPRHAGMSYDLTEGGSFFFEVHLPGGHYDAELSVYSGYLRTGLRTRTRISIRPESLPRVGDPIISQTFQRSGIEAADRGLIDTGGFVYTPTREYRQGLPGRVLVSSQIEDTRLWLQTPDKLPRALERLGSDENWSVFELPAQKPGFRLIALGFPEKGEAVALGSWGPTLGQKDLAGLVQKDTSNYLGLQSLEIEQKDTLSLLFVNDTALVASKNGTFPWPAVDWGELADLRFEYAAGQRWRFAPYQLRRNAVFERLRVEPRYLVAGTSTASGVIRPEPVAVTVLGQPARVVNSTPFSEIPKLWGIVVNDPLLQSPIWPTIRGKLQGWLRRETGPRDLIYLVHSSERPELVVPPTRVKPLVLASLDALAPRSQLESWFRVDYLIEALTHLREHNTRPHQVIVLTNRLSDQVNQLQELLTSLRETGLQLYNLEFPGAYTPTVAERLSTGDMSNFDRMRTEAEEDTLTSQAMRDEFMEDRATPSMLRFSLGGKKRQRATREEAIRLEAFYEAFNQQLGILSAGMGQISPKGAFETSSTRFFDQLSQWQESLVHLELNVPYLEEDMVDVRGKEGVIASWTLVGWKPGD